MPNKPVKAGARDVKKTPKASASPSAPAVQAKPHKGQTAGVRVKKITKNTGKLDRKSASTSHKHAQSRPAAKASHSRKHENEKEHDAEPEPHHDHDEDNTAIFSDNDDDDDYDDGSDGEILDFEDASPEPAAKKPKAPQQPANPTTATKKQRGKASAEDDGDIKQPDLGPSVLHVTAAAAVSDPVKKSKAVKPALASTDPNITVTEDAPEATSSEQAPSHDAVYQSRVDYSGIKNKMSRARLLATERQERDKFRREKREKRKREEQEADGPVCVCHIDSSQFLINVYFLIGKYACDCGAD